VKHKLAQRCVLFDVKTFSKKASLDS